MKLSTKRILFSSALAKLITYGNTLGYGVAVDYVKRCQDCKVGKKNSCHKVGLAADLNIYLDGTYITTHLPHTRLHDRWDTLGGAARIQGDLNHYSFEHQGMR